MICKVRRTIEKYNMPLRDSTVVVGLSGGADSMSLLNVLYSLREELNIRLIACHVNHGIRGEAADRDEQFVKDECERLGVELKIFHEDIPRLAREQGTGLEECGRQVRYEIFSSFDNCIIATAHTLSDRCETLLLNITRGSTLKGIGSIPAVRGNIVRPLIDCTRDEIEDFCEQNNIRYITDETNSDPTYARNRIRLNVIPELKKINPSFEAAVSRLVQSAGEDEAYLDCVADEIIKKSQTDRGYSAEIIAAQHPCIRGRVIAKIIKKQADVTPEAVHVKMITDILGGGRTLILKDTVVSVKDGVMQINPETDEFSEWEYNFNSLSAYTPNGTVFGTVINRNELPPKQFVHNKVLDFDCINGSLVLRNRRAGDRMKCAGSSCTKTLKKLFTEKHIENRNSLPILCDSEGVLWVQGIGCADRCKITEETTKILLIGEEL